MKNRQEWLKERKTYLGGSDIGAVVGANKYRSALDVYFDKTSDGIVDEMSPAAYWGTVLEKTVAEEYAKVTGYSIEVPAGLIRHSTFPYIACNIDYWANDGSLDIPIYKAHLERFGITSLQTGDSVKFEIERVGNTYTILAIELLV